jgi:hypothetical protein
MPPTGRVFLGVSPRMGKGRAGIGGQGCLRAAAPDSVSGEADQGSVLAFVFE